MSRVVGVIGAGTMGSGIAQKYAMEGFEVVLGDVSEAAAAKGVERIERSLAEAVERRIIGEDKKKEVLGRVSTLTLPSPDQRERERLASAEIVIEAVFEDRDVKKKLFRDLDAICGPATIFATNTSSFYVSELAQATSRPDRFVGLHYFFHPAKNKLVEVIRGPRTSDETFGKAWQIQEEIGKLAVESKDRPGFIVNRFFVPWLNEAMRIVHEGHANIATVEAASKMAFGIGMGPFELMNVTGVPITLHAANSLADELGEFYRPCEMILPVVEKKQQWDLGGDADEKQFAYVANRLFSVVFDIAQTMINTEEVCSLEDCDLAARVGLRWKKGPFELAQQFGKQVPAIRFVKGTVRDRVGFITLDRPDALNALDERMVEQLGEQFAQFSHNPEVKGIVLEGRGKAFAAGADIEFFVENLKREQVNRIVEFAAGAQKLFQQIDQSEKPVVCCINGLALGGGLELALACDHIVAAEDAKMGFPETGIGIYPGLGGTQRTPRRVGVPLARWLVLTGEIVDAQKALEFGLVDGVVAKGELRGAALGWLLKSEGKNPPTPFVKGGNLMAETARLFERPLEELVAGNKRLPKKAPLALRKADELIRASAHSSLADGLALETEGLKQIFSTKDAFLGLASVGKAPPAFTGE